ncbi:type VI secretion system baseplate subunit TssG [Labrys sp. KNU-23]|uniref:type VI secretion system baseplate subunit TssG n=1 Tax=Labrys sp. KNU-23 TaxID=2789216 RepID=UPI0011ECCE9C|nr:type VI secretion system baseplate subunit TssG [Labrys sp. KNU-23]QEN85245.1 type VI secretion system baseplate subunit TssG [Labrys sp. KNU-23]
MSGPPDLPQERFPEKSTDFSIEKAPQNEELEKERNSEKSHFADEPGGYDLLDFLRRLEHLAPTKPRIGESASSLEAVAKLGQQPHIDFADVNVSRIAASEGGPAEVESRFLGMLGPQGALPLHTSYEATHWANMRDVAFARFLDIFNNRFQQLFFRAWANARPAVQADRPDENQFLTYLGAMIGIGTPAMRGRGRLHDFSKLTLAGLMAPAVKSASRIEGMLGWLFDAKVEVREFVGVWLPLEEREQAVLAAGSCALGVDSIIGRSAYSLKDKFRIRLEVADLDELETFLPDGLHFEPLADAVRFYLGEAFIYDVEFGLAESKTKPAQLGGFGRLGWTCWMGRKGTAGAADDRMRWDCHFHPAEIRAARRRKPSKG